ncbi:unnamed protein product [Camellia sinensis]
MEASSTAQQSLRCVTMEEGKTFCKCAEGWACEFSKTEASKVGKPFSNCGNSCTCITDASAGQASNQQKTLESSTESKVFIKCGEGWTCTITKTKGPDAGATFLQCGEGCTCLIDETNAVKLASA